MDRGGGISMGVRGRTPKILVAEDYEPLVELYNAWLKDNYEVIPAYNGQEVVDRFKEHRPDLTVIDIRMPLKSGDQAIKEIFEVEPKANIVAVATYPIAEDVLGVEVVRKGFKKDEFLHLVKRKIKAG
jgi:CheY-like chemotaxis protein